MLGGFEKVHPQDVESSLAFLKKHLPEEIRKGGRALDCGAGIGRVAKHLLLPAGFAEVDLLDISAEFLARARDVVGPQMVNAYCSGLDNFLFTEGERKWHLIWVQWCAIYLNDEAFVNFFRRAGQSLADERALVVLKENALRVNRPAEVDKDDSSVTRSVPHMKRLFAAAGMEVVAEELQRGMPAGLYPIWTFALRPKNLADS